MLFSTMHQGLLFLWMMAAGALVCLWYFITAGLRRILQAGFWLSLGCDLLFGAGAAVLLLAFLVAGSHGALRPFAILGASMGAGICAFALLPLLHAAGKLLRRLRRRIVTALSENRLLKVIFK